MDWMELRARCSDLEEKAIIDYTKLEKEVLKRMKG